MSTEPAPQAKEIHPDAQKETKESGGLFAGINKIITWVKKAVGAIIKPFRKTEDHPVKTHPVEEKEQAPASDLAPDLQQRLNSQTKKILDDVSALLKSDAIKGEADKKFLTEAAAFVEKPSGNFPELKGHTTNIGQLEAGYMSEGADVPPAIDALHGYLLALQVVNRVRFVEGELAKGTHDSPEIQEAMANALSYAKGYAKGWKEDHYLNAVNNLQGRLGSH